MEQKNIAETRLSLDRGLVNDSVSSPFDHQIGISGLSFALLDSAAAAAPLFTSFPVSDTNTSD